MGYDDSLAQVEQWYKGGKYTKDEFAAVMRAHKDSQDDVKSEHRKNVMLIKIILGRAVPKAPSSLIAAPKVPHK